MAGEKEKWLVITGQWMLFAVLKCFVHGIVLLKTFNFSVK